MFIEVYIRAFCNAFFRFDYRRSLSNLGYDVCNIRESDLPVIFFRLVSEHAFAGYHLDLARAVSVSFGLRNDGFASTLTIQGKSGDGVGSRIMKVDTQ